jgi:hypothetical protein
LYLDNKEIECGSDTNMAKCDGCGEGLTALERSYVRAATERQLVEETLDELSDGCVACFVESADEPSIDWQHEKEQCPQPEQQQGQDNKDEQGRRENGAEIEKFRESIRFEARSHSCFKCGLSQKLCRTGQDSKETCQWPNVMASMVRRTMSVRSGAAILNKVGFRGNHGDWGEYARWLGLRHERRIWGELMSNATALMIELMVWMREGRIAECRKQDEEVEADGLRGEREVEAKSRGFIATLRSWEGVCLVCKAATRQEVRDHSSEECVRDEFLTEMMKRGAAQIEGMEEPRSEQGRCWVGWEECEMEDLGRGFGCRWSRLARKVAMALLYVGSRAKEVQAWVEEDGEFVEGAERDGQRALERFFKSEVDWSGIESNRLCELIRVFG